jgi:hypothetical protein
MGGTHPKGAAWGGCRTAGRRGALAIALAAARRRPLPPARSARSATPSPRRRSAGKILEPAPPTPFLSHTRAPLGWPAAVAGGGGGRRRPSLPARAPPAPLAPLTAADAAADEWRVPYQRGLGGAPPRRLPWRPHHRARRCPAVAAPPRTRRALRDPVPTQAKLWRDVGTSATIAGRRRHVRRRVHCRQWRGTNRGRCSVISSQPPPDPPFRLPVLYGCVLQSYSHITGPSTAAHSRTVRAGARRCPSCDFLKGVFT